MALRRPHKRMKRWDAGRSGPSWDKPQRYSPLSTPPGFRPRIGVRGMLLIAGIAMALRRPNKRMKVGRWVGFFHRLVVLPLPTPPGFRPSPE